MKIAVVFVGALHDQGFNAVALAGAERARALPGVTIEIVDGLPFEPGAMRAAATAAAERSDAVVFVGGQGNRVVPEVAAAFPGRAFAVVQGAVQGPNLASYDVLQEHSAFLAGVLAARLTRTGTVGHLSGHRVTPGLKGRAAFVSGVRHADPSVTVLSGFCGTQDDGETARRWSAAQAARGVDVLFTMLNAARAGAVETCRATGMRQIGNVLDWVARDPEVFAGSALAAIDLGVERAVADLRAGRRPATPTRLGLGEGAVSLSLAPDLSPLLRAEIARAAQRIAAGTLTPATRYEGPEFSA